MKRYKHSLSNYKLASIRPGFLVPIGLLEALPGDTFQQSTSLLVRVSPLLAPLMHPVSIRVHHWFVPIRLVWDSWEDFITGTDPPPTYPTNTAAATVAVGDLGDYLGLPLGTHPIGSVSLLPARAYWKIYNEFYRDEDLVAEVDPGSDGALSNSPAAIAWEKDYFTTCRPWTQKGPDVTIPMGTAPVVPTAVGASPQFSSTGGGPGGELSVDASDFVKLAPSSGAGNLDWEVTGLMADLSAVGPAINDFRRAFALQRYQEARAQYGSRYTEYLRYIGVRPSDARLQRPEYLGGGKQTLAFSEVLKTADEAASSTGPVGELKGHGIEAMRSNRYRYFCQEHGYIISLVSIRPRSMYVQGIDRTWSRRTKEDYWQRELELIGQQEVFKRELFANGTGTDATVFGYQDRYAEYRHQRSSIAGDFRTTLNFWHMARDFAAHPTLNQAFVECDPTNRVFADQTAGAQTFWVMASHSVQARRPVTARTIGRII